MSENDIIEAIEAKAMEVSDSEETAISDVEQLKKWVLKRKKGLQEAIQVEQLLSMKIKDIKEYNNGDGGKTLQDLNQIMSSLQGTEDKIERKAYFKAKKFYTKLVGFMNKKD